ncbi:MAG TPA: efflux RND transporter periplasmic adaptor subunit [Gemmatimonadales bacterium]|nr:efflux RND transporter periplasmic adaptor subunit [Gemmatimonadales bacterium]
MSEPHSSQAPRAEPAPARRRWLYLALAAAVVVAFFVWRGLPARVEAAPVVRGDVARSIVLTGRVRPTARPLLGVTVGGRVSEVLVREGDRVTAGQLLLRLDDEQAVAAVAEARATLAETRAGASAEVERAARELQQSERDHARAQQLHDAGAISLRELEQAAQAAANARAAFEAASARAASGGSTALAQVARALAALESAEARLALTRLTAPAAGTVVSRRAEPGDAVTPGQVLLELALDGRTEVVAFASEETLGDLRQGAPAVVSADAYPNDVLAARVAWIAPVIDPTQGTIEVRLDLPDPPAYLLTDMTVSVNVDVERREGALVAPREAVERVNADSGWVMVSQDGRAERKVVRLGILGDSVVEIREGVSEGDLVLPSDIEPGARVRVVR